MRKLGLVLASVLALSTAGCRKSDDPATGNRKPQQTKRGAGWHFETKHDAMRNIDTRIAHLISDNKPELKPPYEGGSPAVLALNGEAYLIVINAQLNCPVNDYGPICTMAVKIDDNPVEELFGKPQKCGPLDCTNLIPQVDGPNKTSTFVDMIKGSHKVVVEIPLYHYGTYQYIFHTAGYP